VPPTVINIVAGATEIETSIGGVTVSVTPGEVMGPSEAEIVVAPIATPVATPEALIVAFARLEEFHVTLLVRF